jgi:integrase
MPYAEKRDGALTGMFYGEVIYKERGKADKRFRRRFDTKRAAEGYEAYVKATGMEPPDLQEARLTGPTFAEVAQAARENKDAWKRGKDASGLKRLEYIETTAIGATAVSDVTTAMLDTLVRDLERRPVRGGEGRKMSAGTVNRYLSAASAVLRFALERRLIAHMPTVPWKEETGHRLHWLDAGQEEAVVAYMKEQGWLAESLAVRVLCASGMRWSEFATLEPFQAQGEWIKLDKTKTNTPRDIPIDEQLCGELRAMLRAGTSPLYSTMRKRLKLALNSCGYDPRVGIHNLRHSTATRLTKLDVPTSIVQKFLGHKSITTTLKYVHVEADDLLAAAKKLSPQRGETSQNVERGEIFHFKKASGNK